MSGAALSNAQVDQYRRDGFVFPVAAMSRHEAQGYLGRLEAIEARYRERMDVSPYLRGNPHYVLPMAAELIHRTAILDAVESVLGPDLLVWSSTFFIKEPRSEDHITWHQDLHYWGLDAEDEVTAWLALTPTTSENGCMRFLPGSHLENLEHRDTFAEDNMLSRGQVLVAEVNESDAVEVLLEPGQMSLHHGRLAHASSPNHSNGRRIGIAIRFLAPHMRQVVGGRDYAHLVRGRDAYGHFVSPPLPESEFEPEALERYATIQTEQIEYFFVGVDEAHRPAPMAPPARSQRS